jgi:hypothetical protein
MLDLDFRRFFRSVARAAALLAPIAAMQSACSTKNTTSPSGDDGGAPDAASATCANPGGADIGPADTHCKAADGGLTVQATSAGSCHPTGVDAGAENGCPYGDTLFGRESDDDDCKYHIVWSSDPICQGDAGIRFTVLVTNKTDRSPLTGAGTAVETFTTSPPDSGCDNQSTHPGPNSGVVLREEGPPGTYTGNVQFDQAGAWTVRFHFHAECADVSPDSPHGHAAYHVTVN